MQSYGNKRFNKAYLMHNYHLVPCLQYQNIFATFNIGKRIKNRICNVPALKVKNSPSKELSGT